MLRVTYAVWACLTIVIVTSGHEIAIETLGPEEVTPPAQFKPEPGPLHAQQPCCLQTPIPDSCSCYVKRVAMKDMAMKVEKPAAAERAKQKATGSPALVETPAESLKAKVQAKGNVAPFLPHADIGARVKRKAKAYQDADDQYSAFDKKAKASKWGLIQLEKAEAVQKEEERVIRDQFPGIKDELNHVRTERNRAMSQTKSLELKIASEKQRVVTLSGSIKTDKTSLNEDKEEVKAAVERLKRATKRSHSNEQVKETQNRAKSAKAADAKKATDFHKAGDKKTEAGAKVKKAQADKDKTKANAQNTQDKLANNEGRQGKLKRAVKREKRQVKAKQDEVEADKKASAKAKAKAKAKGAKTKIDKKKLADAKKAEAKKAKAAVKAQKAALKDKKKVALMKRTVKALNNRAKHAKSETKKANKAESKQETKVRTDIRRIRILRNRIASNSKDLLLQKGFIKTQLMKTTKDHNLDVHLQAKLKNLVAAKATRTQTYDKLIGAEKELMVIPSKIKATSDKLASPIRAKCSKIELAATTTKSQAAQMAKDIDNDKLEFTNMRRKLQTPNPDSRKALLAKGGCKVYDTTSPHVADAFTIGLTEVRASAEQARQQIVETAKKVVKLEAQVADAAKNATKTDVKMIKVKLQGKVGEAIEEEVETQSDETKKVPNAAAGEKTQKRALAAAEKKEQQIAKDANLAEKTEQKELAKSKKKAAVGEAQLDSKLQEIKQMDTDGIALNVSTTDATASSVSDSQTPPNKLHADALLGTSLDPNMKQMLADFVKTKMAECHVKLKAPSQAAGTIEQKVKKHLNCHRESKVKGEIKRREMRKQLEARVNAMAVCVKKAFGDVHSNVLRLGTKISASQVKLGSLQSVVKAHEIKLKGCRTELGEAAKDGVAASAVIIKLKNKMEKLKNKDSTDNDKFILAQKKDTFAERTVKAKMTMHSAKLNVMSAKLSKTHGKLGHEKLTTSKEEKKLAAALKASSKLIKGSAKNKFVLRKVVDATASTNKKVSNGERKFDQDKLKAKLGVRQVKTRKAKMKKIKSKVNKDKKKEAKAKTKDKAAKRKTADAKKSEKKAEAVEKKKAEVVKKNTKKMKDEKKKIIKLQMKEKGDAAKIESERSKVAKEDAKLAPLKEAAKLADKKAQRLEAQVYTSMREATAQEDIPTKKRQIQELKREVKDKSKEFTNDSISQKDMSTQLKSDKHSLKTERKKVERMNNLSKMYLRKQKRLDSRLSVLQKSIRKIKVDRIEGQVTTAQDESVASAVRVERTKLASEVVRDRNELIEQVQSMGHRHSEAKANVVLAQNASSRLLNQIQNDETQLAAHKQALIGQLETETEFRHYVVKADANATTIEKTLQAQNEQALTASTRASNLADKEASIKSKIHELRAHLQPVWDAQSLAKEAVQRLANASKKEAEAQQVLAVTKKDLERKSSDRAFAEKIGVEHLTGHVQGALFEAARKSHAAASNALATAEKNFKVASHDHKEAAVSAKQLDSKSATLTKEFAPASTKLADLTASLIATTTNLRNVRVEGVLANHAAEKSIAELKDAKEILLEFHKNATSAETATLEQKADIKTLDSKVLLAKEQLDKEGDKTAHFMAGASEYGAKETSGKAALQEVAGLKLPSPEDSTLIPTAPVEKNTGPTAKSVRQAVKDAKAAMAHAQDAAGALDAAQRTEALTQRVTTIKVKRQALQKEVSKGVNTRGKAQQIKQMKQDETKHQQEAAEAKGRSQKLAEKSKKQYEKTEKEMQQLASKIKAAKDKFKSAKKEEKEADKQAQGAASTATKKVAQTMKARENLQDITKENDELAVETP